MDRKLQKTVENLFLHKFVKKVSGKVFYQEIYFPGSKKTFTKNISQSKRKPIYKEYYSYTYVKDLQEDDIFFIFNIEVQDDKMDPIVIFYTFTERLGELCIRMRLSAFEQTFINIEEPPTEEKGKFYDGCKFRRA